MSLAVRRLLCLATLLALVGCDPGPRFNLRDAGRDGSLGADTDGDGISDADEGAATARDSDGDGTPDFEDSDSDNDGVPDSVEAGDSDPATPPVDTDADLTPDFIDSDSDDNGIPDGMEADGDIDGDGLANRADLDDDGDGIRDRLEIEASGVTGDADADGAPDFQDPDSDNDFISDGQERDQDTDGDGVPDITDLDSDDDGIPDAQEAGDADLETVPFDSDGDLVPDFRDADSDNDGLADGDEVLIHMTDPTDADSDGDGVSDLIEVGAGTNPNDPSDDPRRRGDFVFVVPYMEAPTPERDTLTFNTSIQFADVYFLFDKSGSMGAEISALQSGVVSLLGNLSCTDTGTACTADSECSGDNICNAFTSTCTQNPTTSDCVPSLWSGAGWYLADDSSLSGSQHSRNTQSLQPDPSVTQTVGLNFSVGCSSCGDEPLYSAVTAVSGPGSEAGNMLGCTGPAPGFIGCPGFREDAVRILVMFTDEDSNTDSSGVNVTNTASAMIGAGITGIGVWSGGASDSRRNEVVQLLEMSGSYRADGSTPLIYNADGSDSASFVSQLSEAINEIVLGVPLRVTIDAADEPGDDGDALQFIRALEANTTGTGCSDIATEDANPAGDGIQDTYPAVTPGTPVCWDVIPEMNITVMPATRPLVFEARLTVSGDGSPLDSRRVFFLVPPEIPPPGGPD